MNDGYLDIHRSVVISSPAGSGKTEKLARRYIRLLEHGADVQRILCITFTEKAAAEMKARILDILGAENPELLASIWPRLPLMRIFTIHAFCLKLLKRFSMELGLDPALSVLDEAEARNLFAEALYDGIRAERDAPGEFFSMMRDRGLRGWNALKKSLDALHGKSPYPEILIRRGALPEGPARPLVELYAGCLARYKDLKARRQALDFGDLELLAHEALAINPEWQNILYAFDERTDHVLVDEFQDTSTLQWLIIDKLTEEWRAGMGPKRESGVVPTLFLVGDVKQSIYLFRGANVGVFQEARKRLSEWLGDDYHYVEARENYRSLPAIVDFTNRLFERIMPRRVVQDWMTEYAPFEPTRQGEGSVELVLFSPGESAHDTRAKEASVLAARIRALQSRTDIISKDGRRSARYGDMAVLLRRRTHLALLESALRASGIPFVVLKGIGFYDEPETALLRELISFVVDPSDDHALFCLLRSPLFGVDYETLTRLSAEGGGIYEKIRGSSTARMREVAGTLGSWAGLARAGSLALLIERALINTGGWKHLHEPGRRANVKKFVAMVESLEAAGSSPLEVREKLLRDREAANLPKANVNAEDMDAVKIMTIHAAKGLQFPIVFLPSMDEDIVPRQDSIVIDETPEGAILVGFEEDSGRKKKNEIFRVRKAKELEEEKRLLYVGVTRAMDRLLLLGAETDREDRSRLGFLKDAFVDFRAPDLPFALSSGDGLPKSPPSVIRHESSSQAFFNEPLYVEPLAYSPSLAFQDVTEDVYHETAHGPDAIVIGRVMHRIFEDLSRGLITRDGIAARMDALLRDERRASAEIREYILADLDSLARSGLLDEIVLPRPGAHAELPFVLQRGAIAYKGRIDRVIIADGLARVYDYKTYAIDRGEIPALIDAYRPQIELYSMAAEALFGLKAEGHLFFTHEGLVVKVQDRPTRPSAPVDIPH